MDKKTILHYLNKDIVLHAYENRISFLLFNLNESNIEVLLMEAKEKLRIAKLDKSVKDQDKYNVIAPLVKELDTLRNEISNLQKTISNGLMESIDVSKHIENHTSLSAKLQAKQIYLNELKFPVIDLSPYFKAIGELEEQSAREHHGKDIRNQLGTKFNFIRVGELSAALNITNINNALTTSKNYEVFVTPSVYIKLNELILQDRELNQSIENIKSMDLKNPVIEFPMKTDPYLHQKIGFVFHSNMRNSAILWDMGTGKTKTAIDVARLRFHKKEIDRVFVICPNQIQYKWQKEIELHSDLTSVVLVGKHKRKYLNKRAHFVILSYETAVILQKELCDIIYALNSLVILDESSKVKNPAAKRSNAVIRMGDCGKYKLILTGTPCTQSGTDIWTQWRFLDGGQTFGTSFHSFLDSYFTVKGWRQRPKTDSLEIISDLCYKKATRFLKSDCLDLPQKIYNLIEVDMTPRQASLYTEMVKTCVAEINELDKATAFIILTKLLRLSQITSGFLKNTAGIEQAVDTVNPKMEALIGILEELAGKKVVVWCRFKWEIRQISAYLSSKEIKHGLLYGDESLENRDAHISEFQNGDSLVMLGNAQTGGMGIELHAASDVVYMSNDYSYQNRVQSEDRNHRIGQTRNVVYTDIICRQTIDQIVLSILMEKKSVADIVTKDLAHKLMSGVDFAKSIVEAI